jgi:hypothetical protein
MALQRTDQKQKPSIRNFFNKNFGGDEHYDGVFAYGFYGMFRNVTLWQNKEWRAWTAAALTIFGGVSGTFYAEHVLDSKVDFSPEYAITQSAEAPLFGYDVTLGSGDNTYTRTYSLYEGESGPVLLYNDDDFLIDDILKPVSGEVRNSAVAAEMLTRLYDLRADLTIEEAPASEEESERDLRVYQYEGFSHPFVDATQTDYSYVIGDNVTLVDNITLEQVDAEIATWTEALEQFTQNPNLPLDTVMEGEHQAENTHPGMTLVYYFAGLLGTGAAAGMGMGIAASRRRYNKQIKLKR